MVGSINRAERVQLSEVETEESVQGSIPVIETELVRTKGCCFNK